MARDLDHVCSSGALKTVPAPGRRACLQVRKRCWLTGVPAELLDGSAAVPMGGPVGPGGRARPPAQSAPPRSGPPCWWSLIMRPLNGAFEGLACFCVRSYILHRVPAGRAPSLHPTQGLAQKNLPRWSACLGPHAPRLASLSQRPCSAFQPPAHTASWRTRAAAH